MKRLLVYLLLINAASLFLMHADKEKAKKNIWRIPERLLLTMAIIGGSGGCLLGMYLFHHKIKKPKFYITIPLLFFLESILFLLCIKMLPF